jgi:hypothetical protein
VLILFKNFLKYFTDPVLKEAAANSGSLPPSASGGGASVAVLDQPGPLDDKGGSQ